MPFIETANGTLHYQLEGPAGAPVLVLSNSLGTELAMWDTQMPAFINELQVLRYDTRGHGRSEVSEGFYSIEQLGQDVLALLDALHIERASFCGLSMGGLIGQWLGINAGQRIDKLVLCNTAAKIANDEVWNGRIETVLKGREQAMRELRDGSVARWFTPDYAAANPQTVERITRMLETTSPEGYAANCAAVRDADFRGQLESITAPTLIITGSADEVTTTEHGRAMQASIADAELVEFEAAHLSNVQAGDTFTEAVLAFIRK
ncbi:3-oxoadipate enol-lactonase [Pseudomonas sp. gcc21]|uniref:3-oxoadipate enol-lactonase n=1 Tax=Pseudomonas sp. gcc21 TaxID=2726989 RepID=UPI001451AE00|nr:3-oxoadipate enol-lactonase [Pseudomonas sp. gcc21]QJD57673.1 3-oxoadipate enol-lactonase [Pseudomonas sp. gcc21]